jgi:hypothetical protein
MVADGGPCIRFKPKPAYAVYTPQERVYTVGPTPPVLPPTAQPPLVGAKIFFWGSLPPGCPLSANCPRGRPTRLLCPPPVRSPRGLPGSAFCAVFPAQGDRVLRTATPAAHAAARLSWWTFGRAVVAGAARSASLFAAPAERQVPRRPRRSVAFFVLGAVFAKRSRLTVD